MNAEEWFSTQTKTNRRETVAGPACAPGDWALPVFTHAPRYPPATMAAPTTTAPPPPATPPGARSWDSFPGLLAVLESPRWPVDQACAAVERCLEVNR